VGALKKPPGATWVHLVVNGPPISISTWCILFVRRPKWILGGLAVLAAEKEVSPGQVPGGGVRAYRDHTPKSSIAASFVSNLSHLGSPPRRIPPRPAVLKWGPSRTLTTWLINSALCNNFNLFSLLYNLIQY